MSSPDVTVVALAAVFRRFALRAVLSSCPQTGRKNSDLEKMSTSAGEFIQQATEINKKTSPCGLAF
jgi:hypothetical protein